MPAPDLADRDYRALASFRHELRGFLSFSEAMAREAGLEPQQHQLLLALRGLPEGATASVQTLAERLVLRHHTVVELLDRCEAGGLVRRTRDAKDRRRSALAITPRGARVLAKLASSHLDELRSRAPALVASLDDVLRTSRRRAA